MAESKKNIYQKLSKARLDFLKANIKKSGINDHAEYDYFELADIVPTATKILDSNGLIFIVTFPAGIPQGTLYDMDSDQYIVFESPVIEGDLVTTQGKKLMMSIQSEGAKQTYHRRYLYMQMLDIVERDEIDAVDKDEAPVLPKAEPKKPTTKKPSAKKPTAPPTVYERQEIKKQIVAKDEPASDLQVKALKKALSELKKIDPSQEEFIQKIVLKTNKLTNLTKSTCETLILKVGELTEECKKK